MLFWRMSVCCQLKGRRSVVPFPDHFGARFTNDDSDNPLKYTPPNVLAIANGSKRLCNQTNSSAAQATLSAGFAICMTSLLHLQHEMSISIACFTTTGLQVD